VKLTIEFQMSSRKVTSSEIQAVGSILQDKEAIELLKKINEQVVTEEDTKGKRKQNDIFAFVGFAHQDDILGEDPESKEYQQKQGSVKRLVDTGLILEGFHIPLERKNEKKFGDVRVSDTEHKIGKYKLTEEGLTLLSIVGDQQSSTTGGGQTPPQTKQTAATTKKDKAIAEFKQEIKEENKL
jgi:hypothetical protein